MSSLLILSTFNANNMRLATKEDASLANLPEELILQIISPFNQGELAKISYTCKRLAFILEKPLYTSVTQTSWTTLPLFVRSLIDRPELGMCLSMKWQFKLCAAPCKLEECSDLSFHSKSR